MRGIYNYLSRRGRCESKDKMGLGHDEKDDTSEVSREEMEERS